MVFLYPFVNWSKSLPFKPLETEVFNNRITMTETVNQENNTANETQEERTFTQSQLDAIIQAGCDPSSIVVDNIAGLISIHAPVGATFCFRYKKTANLQKGGSIIFNSVWQLYLFCIFRHMYPRYMHAFFALVTPSSE